MVGTEGLLGSNTAEAGLQNLESKVKALLRGWKRVTFTKTLVPFHTMIHKFLPGITILIFFPLSIYMCVVCMYACVGTQMCVGMCVITCVKPEGGHQVFSLAVCLY